jgi:hypothetical protein
VVRTHHEYDWPKQNADVNSHQQNDFEFHIISHGLKVIFASDDIPHVKKGEEATHE